jgi:predicted kinase
MPSDRLDHPVLVLVSGLPGLGKTTHARVVEQRLSALRLSADDWLEELALDLWDEDARDRIEQLQWQLTKRLVAVGVSVVIEWGTWSRTERDRIRVEAQRLGARTELHHLAAPGEVLYQRVVRRGREQPAIGRQQIAQWEVAFEVPTRDETERWDHFESIDTSVDRR